MSLIMRGREKEIDRLKEKRKSQASYMELERRVHDMYVRGFHKFKLFSLFRSKFLFNKQHVIIEKGISFKNFIRSSFIRTRKYILPPFTCHGILTLCTLLLLYSSTT